MTDFVESEFSEQSCDEYDCDDDCDYGLYHDYDYEYKPRPKKGQKSFRKSSNSWNLDRTRLHKMKKLACLPMPKKSLEILSKLVINHQLKEIVKVLKVAKNCVTLHVKVNLDNKFYSHLKSEDVVIKIFTLKNHKKPDVESAKHYQAEIYHKSLDVLVRGLSSGESVLQSQLNYCRFKDHSYEIMRIENVVVAKFRLKKDVLKEAWKENPALKLEYTRGLVENINYYSKCDFHWAYRKKVKKYLYDNSDNEIIKFSQVKTHNEVEKLRPKVYSISKSKSGTEDTNLGRYLQRSTKKQLPVIRIDNEVKVRNLKLNSRATNLIDMIRNNPSKRSQFYREIMEIVKMSQDWNSSFYLPNFWCEKTSLRNILWLNGEWNFICKPEKTYRYQSLSENRTAKSSNHCARNVIAVMKLFQEYGVPKTELLKPFEFLYCLRWCRGWNRHLRMLTKKNFK